jgi:tannase/feruloyl esterase
METSASFEARYAPLLYPTNHVVLERFHFSGNRVNRALIAQCPCRRTLFGNVWYTPQHGGAVLSACVSAKSVIIPLRPLIVSLLAFSAASALDVRAARAATCESLATLALPDTTITLAKPEPSGTFTPSKPVNLPGPPLDNLPTFCRVAGEIKPTKDSDIRFEVWMPASGWNGKFMGIGNGGWAGGIWYNDMGDALRRGYASASTNAGHEGWDEDASFALGHPEKVIDFGYRAVHEMTVKAKAILTAYYGDAPKHSYWNGCSTGGKQGLKEAQRFPRDYDGVIAGAPANFWTHLMVSGIWIAEAIHDNPTGYVPEVKRPLIHKAVLEACDALDGVKDGVLEDPRHCHFDPKVLLCKDTDGPDCLTAAQVEAAKKIYAGPRNPRTGEQIFPGLEPGSESEWNFFTGGREPPIVASYFKYLVFKNPNWDFRSLNFDSDVALADKLDNGLITATDPNLKEFFAQGGKLFLYHGWSDGGIAPQNTINYYNSVVAAMGGSDIVHNSVRLFMVPGMNHCYGGVGPFDFDAISTLEQWVESGKVPDRIIAAHIPVGTVPAKPDRTRPLCPYPQVAKYKGSGSTDDASNFVCAKE